MMALIASLFSGFASSAFLGFATTMVPKIINFWENKERYKYDLEITRLKLEIAEKGHDVTKIMEDRWVAIEGDSIRRHDMDISTNESVNIFRALIRPTITIAFFILFIIIKIATLIILAYSGITGVELITGVWDDFTQSIFGAIVGFWFGGRTLGYMRDQFAPSVVKGKD